MPGRRPHRVATAVSAVALLLLTGALGGCAATPGTTSADRDASADTLLVQPLAAPGTAADSSGAVDVPEFLVGGSWGQAFSLGRPATRTSTAPGSTSPPDTGREMVVGADPAGPAPGLEPDPRRVVSLPTGVGSQAREPVAAPVRVQVPRLGIDSNLDPLGLRPDGELQAPPRWKKAGWYTGGPRPGAVGPAVIAGHLDSPVGPAVFAALPQVRAGDRVVVTDVLGTTHTFAVTRVTRTPKTGFPTRAVYGAVPGSELRLITCTGSYVAEDGGYQDNLLVFATMVQG